MAGDANDSTDWRQLREFADVDLTRSFVLSWLYESDTLTVDIDVLLTTEHAFYERPRPAEKVCIRPASIVFPHCEDFGPDGVADGQLSDIANNLGAGAIAGLRRLADDRYEISGDFGTVFVSAERPLLKLKQR
jgi:hypothetical protein